MKKEYKKALELLNESGMKQAQIADELDISLAIVKKLSQLNKLYKQVEDKELLAKVQDLNFKALELNYLTHMNALGEVMENINEKSTRNEIRSVCEKINYKRLKELEELKEKQCRVESELRKVENSIQAKINTIDFYEGVIRNIKISYEWAKEVLKDFDEVAAACVYSKYMAVRFENDVFGKKRPMLALRIILSKRQWQELKRKGIISYYRYDFFHTINEIVKIGDFIDYMYSKKKKTEEIGNIKIEKDKQDDVDYYRSKIKEAEMEIISLNEKLSNLKRLETVNNLQDEIKRIESKENKNVKRVKKIVPIKIEDYLFKMNNVIVEGVKIETVILNKDCKLKFYIRDNCSREEFLDYSGYVSESILYEKMHDTYSVDKFQKLKRYADYIIIAIDMGYPILKMYTLKIDNEEIAKKYEIEREKKQYIQYLLGLEMTKKFLY